MPLKIWLASGICIAVVGLGGASDPLIVTRIGDPLLRFGMELPKAGQSEPKPLTVPNQVGPALVVPEYPIANLLGAFSKVKVVEFDPGLDSLFHKTDCVPKDPGDR